MQSQLPPRNNVFRTTQKWIITNYGQIAITRKASLIIAKYQHFLYLQTSNKHRYVQKTTKQRQEYRTFGKTNHNNCNGLDWAWGNKQCVNGTNNIMCIRSEEIIPSSQGLLHDGKIRRHASFAHIRPLSISVMP